jgi:anti-sigma B factor antagonist
MTPCAVREVLVDMKLGHYTRDGIDVIDVAGEIDVSTAPRLRALLIDLTSKNSCHLVVDLAKVQFLDSAGVGVLVGAAKRARANDSSLVLVCTQARILKVFKITGLTKVFAIHETVDQAIAATKPGQ